MCHLFRQLFLSHQDSHSEYLLLLEKLLAAPGDPRWLGNREWLSFSEAQPAVGLASDYLHRNGDLGRSRPHRRTHTARAASAAEAGRTSTPARGHTRRTVAGRLAPDEVGRKKREALISSKTPAQSWFLHSPTLRLWGHREQEKQENNLAFISTAYISCQALYKVLYIYEYISSSWQPYGVDITNANFTDEEQTHRG